MLEKVRDWLGLERDMVVMVVTVLILTLGGQIWSRYVPKYLEYLGASTLVIGLYGSIKAVVTALYQYPGGWVPDRLGPKKALIVFTFIAIGGYVVYLLAPSWKVFLLGTFLVLIWDSMSQPAIFSLIGETLKKSRRAIGFSVQSVLKRLPIIVAPPLGGYLIEVYGIERGMKVGFSISILLALLAVAFQEKFYVKIRGGARKVEGRLLTVWREMDRGLKRLLVSDIMARLASNIIGVYVVLYVLNVLGASPVDYGLLISVQMTTSILSYFPAAKLADIYGRKPFITLTFTFFALFPLVLALIPNPELLPLAFIVAGLREIGETARKALIVDLAEKSHKGRSIGLYYLIREGLMIPAPLLGGLLWEVSPKVMFLAASAVGILGVIIFTLGRIEE